jgi:3D-(3,5/4)-trihydroxycyclohexane-1,2-dione acylhydrolase (decyclizing)
VLQQIEQYHDLSISTNDCFRPVSRYWDRINRPEQLMSAMLSAMRTLTDPETGAVTICLPQDVQGEADYPLSFFARRVHHIERRPPDPSVGAGAGDLIARKRRPLVVCGGGCAIPARMRRFAICRDAAAAVCRNPGRKRALVSDHPLNLGIGVTGGMAANQLARRPIW